MIQIVRLIVLLQEANYTDVTDLHEFNITECQVVSMFLNDILWDAIKAQILYKVCLIKVPHRQKDKSQKFRLGFS